MPADTVDFTSLAEVLSLNFFSICLFDIIVSTSLNVLFLQIVLFSFLF